MSPRPVVLPVDGCARDALDGLFGEVVVTVYGTPAPQGSKSAKGSYLDKSGNRHVRLVESSKKVKPWRADVQAAAEAVVGARASGFPFAGPLEAEMVFTLPRPGRMPRERVVGAIALPMAYPDVSKLARSTEDALTAAGVWLDDAQVVEYRRLGKRYVGEPGALDRPGAVIRVRRIGGAP